MTPFVEIFDPRARPVVEGAERETLCTGAVWGEGPVWIESEQCLLWSDIPNNRMLRWHAQDGMSTWAENVEFTNGHYLDLNGDLLHCSHGHRAIMRTPRIQGKLSGHTPMQVVVDRYQGKRLNSPNDIIVKRDGTIWFTDPPYGILSDREGHKAEREQPANYVFRFDPRTQTLTAVSDWLEEPNGLAFSPDETQLYVSDTSAALRPEGEGNHHIVVFDVNSHVFEKDSHVFEKNLHKNFHDSGVLNTDSHTILHNPRVFAVISPGLADGFRIDSQGWIYTSSEDSVQIYHPDGTRLAKLHVPEKIGNLTFGGGHLYVAASSSLYRMSLPKSLSP